MHRKKFMNPITGITVKVKQIPLEVNTEPIPGREISIIGLSWLLIFFYKIFPPRGICEISWWDFITIPAYKRYIQAQKACFYENPIIGIANTQNGDLYFPTKLQTCCLANLQVYTLMLMDKDKILDLLKFWLKEFFPGLLIQLGLSFLI